MKIEYLHSRGPELVGLIPQFLDENDPRSVREQFNENYAHGGGWHPFKGFTFAPKPPSIKYPGDPALSAVARISFRDETVLIFQHAWVLILQASGAWEVARMD